MKTDSKNLKTKKLGATLIKCQDKEQELKVLRKELLLQILPYFKFNDFDEEGIDLDEYLGSLSIEPQTDGFVFADEYSRNIIVSWVINHIEENGKINYSQFLNLSV